MQDALKSHGLLDFSQASLEATGLDVWSAKYEARGHSADLLLLDEKSIGSR